MSESDGLKKLTEYLQQTRRQAESAIDVLNEKVSELQHENKLLNQMIEKLEVEREQFKNQTEQLKLENTAKWKFQERDDWKALVDSVQKDRSRLQELCTTLESELETCRHENEELRAQLLSAMSPLASASSPPATPDRPRPSSSDPSGGEGLRITFAADETTEESGTSSCFNSPILDRQGNELHFLPSETPRAVTKTLKHELRRAHSQLEDERRRAEEEQLLQRVEITRLKEELSSLRPLLAIGTTSAAAGSTSAPPHPQQAPAPRSTPAAATPASWFALSGLLGFWFPAAESLPPATPFRV